MTQQLDEQAIHLLEQLITISSFSKEEDKTATVIEGFFRQHEIPVERKGNNVIARNKFFDAEKPTILRRWH